MSFAPWIVNFRPLQRNLHNFQILSFSNRVFHPILAICKDFMHKSFTKCQKMYEKYIKHVNIWKLCKFRCNGRKFTIHGAKDIYSIQRFQWMNFRIEISTIYPQMKTFVHHVNSIKIAKQWNFRNYIWDEFLQGWVLTLKNGKFRCFRCVLHRFWMRYDL